MKINNTDYWFMSLGTNCADIPLLKNERIKGPVDNVWITEPLVIKNLLLNEYFKRVVTVQPTVKNKPGGLNDQSYTYEGFEIFHNNPTTTKYFLQLRDRISTFNSFLNDIYLGKPNYFIITLNSAWIDYKTRKINKTKLVDLMQILKDLKLLQNVIFVEIKQLNYIVSQDLAYRYINNWSVDLGDFVKAFGGYYCLLSIDSDYHTETDWNKLHIMLKNTLEKEIFYGKQ